MKDQINTIREALERAQNGLKWYRDTYPDADSQADDEMNAEIEEALTALSGLEAMVGEQEPCGWFESLYGAFRGNPLLNITFPASTLTWQIPAFIAAPPAQQQHERHLLNLLARIHGDGGHYTAEHGLEKSVSDADQKVADLHLKAWEAQQPQYEAGDMASAAAQGFRDGVASLAQHPHEIEVQCPVCNHKFYEWPNDQQPQAEKRCQYCDGTGDVHSIDGQWCGECHCQKQPQAEPFGYVSQHTNGSWEFSPTAAGVYPDTAKSITAVYTKQPQAEAVHHKPVRVCHIKDVACSEAAVKCGECPDAAPQQAEAVPPGFVVDRGFRWDGEKQQHIPQLTIEFEPVPANGPCDAQGWKDRDAVAQMFAAAQGEKP